MLGTAAVLVISGGAAAYAALTVPLSGHQVSLLDLPEWAPLAPSGNQAHDLVLTYTVDTEMAHAGPYVSYGVKGDATLVQLSADRFPAATMRRVGSSEVDALPQARLLPTAPEGTELTYRGPGGRRCVAARWSGTSHISDVFVDEGRIGDLLPPCAQH